MKRRLAWGLLIWSTVAMFVNCGLYLAHVVDEKALIFVTLVLSYLALILSAIDGIFIVDKEE